MHHKQLRTCGRYKVTKKDIRFFLIIMIPTLAELILAQFFGIADTVMLGKLPDSAILLSAVGVATHTINFIICVITAFCIGTTVTIAVAIGAGKPERARTTMRQSLLLMGSIGCILTLLCVLFSSHILEFAGTNTAVFPYALEYYRIIAASFFFQTVTIVITAALRGVGITKIPMLYNLSSICIKIFLNTVFIHGKFEIPYMGIKGAALATTIAKLIAFLIAVFYIFFAKSPLRLQKGDSFRPDISILRQIVRIGFASGMEQVILQSGNLLSIKFLANVPTADFAAYQIATNIETIAWQLGGACCAASTTCVGQAVGENKPEKAAAMTRIILLSVFLMSVLVMGSFILYGQQIVGFYTENAEISKMALCILYHCTVALPGVSIHQTIAGSLRGYGDTRTPLIASLCSLWIFRVILGYLLIPVMGMGVIAMRVCVTLDQYVRAGINFLRFLYTQRIKNNEL